MEARAKKVLFDTNIWIDCIDPSRPEHASAKMLLDFLLMEPGNEVFYSAGCLKDIYFILAKSMKISLREEKGGVDLADAQAANEIAWAAVESIGEMASSLPLDMRALWMVPKLREYSFDFEDCLMLAACELFGIDCLVTADRQLLAQAPGAVFTARDMLAYLEAVS